MSLLAVTAALPLSSHGASLILDFSNHVDADGNTLADLSSPAVNPDSGGYPDFNNDGTYTMYFQDVTGDGTIDATLVGGTERNTEWAAGKSTVGGNWSNNLQWPHGNLDGDIRVNAGSCYRNNMDNNTACGEEIAGQTIEFTLYLWADGGSNALDYMTPYDPGVDYDWTLAFYDIDSNNSDSCDPECLDGSSWDEITLLSPGTYQVTATTDLAIDDSGTGVNFSGVGVGSVAGQDGLENPITQEQADIMVLYTLMNTSSVSFEYTVGYTDGAPMTVRNFLMDGGSLALATCEGEDCGFLPPVDVVSVPEPAPLALISLGLAALGFARKRRRG